MGDIELIVESAGDQITVSATDDAGLDVTGEGDDLVSALHDLAEQLEKFGTGVWELIFSMPEGASG